MSYLKLDLCLFRLSWFFFQTKGMFIDIPKYTEPIDAFHRPLLSDWPTDFAMKWYHIPKCTIHFLWNMMKVIYWKVAICISVWQWYNLVSELRAWQIFIWKMKTTMLVVDLVISNCIEIKIIIWFIDSSWYTGPDLTNSVVYNF